MHSDILMRDTVMLVRKRVGDPEMAFKDEMLDSVVTMAAIEVRRRFLWDVFRLDRREWDLIVEHENQC